jgi:hypothetical protein
MAAFGSAPSVHARPFSVKRRVDRKILIFSACVGLLATVMAGVVYIATLSSKLRDATADNRNALSQIHCMGENCDTSEYTTDYYSNGPDYVIDTRTRYFLEATGTSTNNPAPFGTLDVCDTAFIDRFVKPASYLTPDGEVWRLYSRKTSSKDGARAFDIIVGYAQKAPWKILEAQPSEIPVVDDRLQEEVDRIAQALSLVRDSPSRALTGGQKLAADGAAIVDANTGDVLASGPWVPMFLREGSHPPSAGRALYMKDTEAFVAETDVDGRLTAVSLVPVGDVRVICIVAIAVFLTASLIARSLSRRFLRRYFVLSYTRVPDLDEALRDGEGQHVEFKRGLSESETGKGGAEEELLKTIGAFANTADGVIFIGVDDGGKIKGLDLDFSQRDRLERKIRQLVRNRIKPTPPFQVKFQHVGERIIASVAVARGEEPAYLLNGVIYYRYGSSDVQAQPEDLRRLIADFAY